MKKTALLAVLLAGFCLSLPVYGAPGTVGAPGAKFGPKFALGLEAGAWLSENPYFGPGVLFSINRVIHFALEYSVDLSLPYNLRFGLCGDYWIFRPKIGDYGLDRGRLFLFCGAGIFVNYTDGYTAGPVVSTGFRIPFGVEYEIKRMDFYLQAAPAITLLRSEKGGWPALSASFGARWWL